MTTEKKSKPQLSLQQQIEALEAKMLAQKAKLREKQQKLVAKAESEKSESRIRIGKLAEEAGLLDLPDSIFKKAFEDLKKKDSTSSTSAAAAESNSNSIEKTVQVQAPTQSAGVQTKTGFFNR